MNNQQESKVVYLRLDDIIPNRFQPREIFDTTGLEELADSIKEHGVIQPIIVRPIGDKYELIAGERRSKASALAGLTTIPAIVRNMDDKESAKVSLLENLQRKNLSAIEEARTYKRILELDNMTQEDLARTMGRSQPMVANKLRLLSLPEEVQEALMKNQISERHARSLLTLPNKKAQLMFLDKIISERLTVRELDARIKKYKESDEQDVGSSEGEMLNKNEERFMSNNRGNFGGMGLNDYQSGINNPMFNNIPNNFNNMPNITPTDNNQVNYNDFNEIQNSNNYQDETPNQFNSNNLEQPMNNSSLGSMLDDNNNFNNETNNDNTNLFVSHIREDNVPKVENQFLPNFDNFANNQFNNANDSSNDTREALNNFENNMNYQSNNQLNNSYDDNNQFNSQNMYMNNMQNNNFEQEINNNQYLNNNFMEMNNSFENNSQFNSNDMNNNYSNNLNNNFEFNPINDNFNSNTNYDYQNNQGEMFNQPLNIVDNSNQSSWENNNQEQNFNDNPLDDQYENILYANPVPIQQEQVNESTEPEVNMENNLHQEEIHNDTDTDIEIIGDYEDNNKVSEPVADNQYIKLEPEKTITDTMSAIMELKRTTDAIKMNNIPIETEEIDFGDVYQITIKLKKTE